MLTASERAMQRSPSAPPEWALPSSPPEWASFNLGLLAALAACVGFWALVGLTLSWLI
jgi:hypothetical protein